MIGDVDFFVGNEWNNGFTGNIEITNTGDTAINGWELKFDAPFEVNSIWGGKITSHEGNRYEISNVDWDGAIAPGQSIKFGFNGSNSDSMDLALSNVELNDVLIATTEQNANSAMV
ncbi:MAG: cellulose binding domain-containing protein [Cyanobacteria bacterium J06639_18]